MACKVVLPGDHDSTLILTNASTNYLYQAYVGRVTASSSNTVSIFVDDNATVVGTTSTLADNTNRTWYDGVSYAKVGSASALVIQNAASYSPGTFSFTWNSLPPESLLLPQTFTVQKKNSLNDINWTTLATGVPSGGTTTTFTDDSASGEAAFYRIMSP